MKIRAAVFRDENLDPSIEELELTGPQSDEVLVRITATGVCHTDLKTAGPGGRSPRARGPRPRRGRRGGGGGA